MVRPARLARVAIIPRAKPSRSDSRLYLPHRLAEGAQAPLYAGERGSLCPGRFPGTPSGGRAGRRTGGRGGRGERSATAERRGGRRPVQARDCVAEPARRRRRLSRPRCAGFLVPPFIDETRTDPEFAQGYRTSAPSRASSGSRSAFDGRSSKSRSTGSRRCADCHARRSRSVGDVRSKAHFSLSANSSNWSR